MKPARNPLCTDLSFFSVKIEFEKKFESYARFIAEFFSIGHHFLAITGIHKF